MKRIRIKSKPEEACTVIVDDKHAFTINENELDEFSYALERMRSSSVDTFLYGDDDIEARLETDKSRVSLIYQYFYFGYDDELIIELVNYLEERFEKVIIDQDDWQTELKLDDFEVTLRQNEDYIYHDMLFDEIKKIADELKGKTKTVKS